MKNRYGVRPIVQWVAIVLLLALLVAMVVTEAVRSRDALARERVKVASYTYSDRLAGYLFRNEIALRTNNNGPVEYTVADGAAVAADTVVARVYTDDTATDKRERAAALYDEIERCERALAAAAQPWPSDYLTAYDGLTRALSAGDTASGADRAAAVADTLARRSAAEDTTAEALRAEIEALRAEIADLVKYVDAPQSIPAADGGRFYRRADGYEALCGLAAAETLTPESLDTLLATKQETTDTVGKLVTAGEWCLVLPVAAELTGSYAAGERYTVYFEQSAAALELPLEKIALSESGDRALLFLRGSDALCDVGAERRQIVCVEKKTVTGLRIPAAALLDGNTVFVDEGGVARVRRVTPIVRENGCLLVAPADEEGALRAGERVLLGARRIYDGKVLNKYAGS